MRVRAPKYVNGMTNREGLDDDVVEGLYDSEDDRAITLVDGFDVTVPINQGKIVAILIAKPNKKTEDDEYYSDELDGSDSDESGDEERPSLKDLGKKNSIRTTNLTGVSDLILLLTSGRQFVSGRC